jgi:hypothetical protein
MIPNAAGCPPRGLERLRGGLTAVVCEAHHLPLGALQRAHEAQADDVLQKLADGEPRSSWYRFFRPPHDPERQVQLDERFRSSNHIDW